MDRIVINKDSIQFGETLLYPPFCKQDVDELLGKPVVKEQKINGVEIQPLVFVWDSIGLAGFLSKDQSSYDGFIINMNALGCHYKYLVGRFYGSLIIGNKSYRDCKWKKDDYDIARELKVGVFELSTDFIEDHSENDEYYEMYTRLDGVVEIHYKKPRTLNKYKLLKV